MSPRAGHPLSYPLAVTAGALAVCAVWIPFATIDQGAAIVTVALVIVGYTGFRVCRAFGVLSNGLPVGESSGSATGSEYRDSNASAPGSGGPATPGGGTARDSRGASTTSIAGTSHGRGVDPDPSPGTSASTTPVPEQHPGRTPSGATSDSGQHSERRPAGATPDPGKHAEHTPTDTTVHITRIRQQHRLTSRTWLEVTIPDQPAHWLPVYFDPALLTLTPQNATATTHSLHTDSLRLYPSGRARTTEPPGRLIDNPIRPTPDAPTLTATTTRLPRRLLLDAQPAVAAPFAALLWIYLDGGTLWTFTAALTVAFATATWLPAIRGSDPS